MSYVIRIPAETDKTVTRAEFAQEAQTVIDSYHAYDGGPLEFRVRAHMQEAIGAVKAIFANTIVGKDIAGVEGPVIAGETFDVTISGHVHSEGDSLDYQSITVSARS